MYLIDFQSELSNIIDKEPISIRINDMNIESEDMIFGTILRRTRLAIPCINKELKIDIKISKYLQPLGYAILSEFPNCCGRVVLYQISLFDHFTCNLDDLSIKKLSDEQYIKYVDLFLELVQKMCKDMHYSSLQFIISEYEQSRLYSAIKYRSINKFINYRMPHKNKCHDYIINLEIT